MSLSTAVLRSRSLISHSHLVRHTPATTYCQRRSLNLTAPAYAASKPSVDSGAKKAKDPVKPKTSKRPKRRTDIDEKDSLEMPPIDEWRSYFTTSQLSTRERVSIRNPVLAEELAHSFLDSPHTASNEPKTVIEAFPGTYCRSTHVCSFTADEIAGPGQLSRALLKLPASKLKRLIILEDIEEYLKYLRVR